MYAIPNIARRAFCYLHIFMLFLIAIVLLAFTSGCAGGFGLVRVMEPPLKNIDTAELSANLPEGKALLIDYSFDSVQAGQNMAAANDGTLSMGTIKDLLSMGAGIGSGASTKELAILANKDRRIHSTIIIADSSDITSMRRSDNGSKLVQQTRSVDVLNRLVVTQDIPVVVDQVNPDTTVIDATSGIDDDPASTITNNTQLAPVVENPPVDIKGDTLSEAWWGPKKEGNPAGAKITCLMTGAKITSSGVSWEDDRPSNWSAQGVGSAIVNAVIYIAVERNGQWYASKFDWVRPGQTSKDFANIRDGYDGLVISSGEPVCFVITSIDGRERSTASNILAFP